MKQTQIDRLNELIRARARRGRHALKPSEKDELIDLLLNLTPIPTPGSTPTPDNVANRDNDGGSSQSRDKS